MEGDNKSFFVKVCAHVRYWEDSEINGVEDNPKDPKMPCIGERPDDSPCTISNGLFWQPIIDVETGQIINWEKDIVADIHYKVCDECGITILKNGNILYKDEDYVPDFLCPKEKGYGDYIIMDVDNDGFIKDWDKTEVYDFLFVADGY